MDTQREVKTGGLIVVLVCLFVLPAFGQTWYGSGTEGDPYQIWTAEDMQAIGADSAYWDAHFELMDDIDLGGYTGTSYNRIGTGSVPFTGVFDGNGHTISNFTYTSTDASHVGIFGFLHGEIKDLELIDPNVDVGHGSWVGSLVAVLEDATISGCYVEGGSISGLSIIGGLVADSNGIITNCYSSANVRGNNIDVGGLVGRNKGTITNCNVTGSVSGGFPGGGLVGRNEKTGGTITNCSSTGSVSGYSVVGGLVGGYYGTIRNCYSTGSVSAGTSRVGGLVGEFRGTMSNCYSTGSVTGNTRVGGLMGQFSGTMSNCYSTGSVTGTAELGGLVGFSSRTVSACFWDVQTSGQTTSACGMGKTTAEMQTESMFTSAGWDFTTPVWTIDEGVDYPRLAWEPASLSAGIDMDEMWMYQSLPGQSNSDLTAGVSVTDDPMGNSSYSYAWEILLPGDVSLAPVTVGGGGVSDGYWTFAARGCDEPAALSDSGQTFKVRVRITGDDYGNTGVAEAEFGIALLGDVNNDAIINVADRSIANAFWRLGSVGTYTLRDCDVNSDGIINVADRSIANAVWRGLFGQNFVSSPCPLR